MKLDELNPRWWTSLEGRQGMGVNFDCPHCMTTPARACTGCKGSKVYDGQPCGGCNGLGFWRYLIVVPFKNPIDGGAADSGYKNHWLRSGDTFDTLTLAPSIDASKTHAGGWHGHVQGGRIV